MLNFGVIGLGDVSRTILQLANDETNENICCSSVLVRNRPITESERNLVGSRRITTSITEFLAPEINVVLDCAGHEALAQYGETILASGCSLITASTGAFADKDLFDRISAAAMASGQRVIIPAGAIAGIDGLAAARHAGLTKVDYLGCKPAIAWNGTRAEELVDLENLESPTTFYRGTAREAAADFPKNANVCATVALAGVGFDNTTVSLVADPFATKNRHQLIFEGTFGRIAIEIVGNPSSTNPKTSMLTALSIWQALKNEPHGIVVI
ncbi:aspartate dehydrogenase [Ruegeria atlantica]|uniref:aspartate dehydrogenase n=1 Tax=Ruegeria atlantica TaxID=81569 RepID=UPI00147DB7C6|nr:aspartate dehydrogenase [Ruegeria atlantica]